MTPIFSEIGVAGGPDPRLEVVEIAADRARLTIA
jgi:hypothetical protein